MGRDDADEGDVGFWVMNDRGQLWAEVTFTDGSSGLFVAQVPKPTTGVALGLGVWAAVGRRRRIA